MPSNEVADGDGSSQPKHGEPNSQTPPRRGYDDPSAYRLRRHLRRSNGIRGLDIRTPARRNRPCA